MILQKLSLLSFGLNSGDRCDGAICSTLKNQKNGQQTFQARGIGIEVMTNARGEICMVNFIIKERNCKEPRFVCLSKHKHYYLIIHTDMKKSHTKLKF